MRANFIVTSPDLSRAAIWSRLLPWGPVAFDSDSTLRRELLNPGPKVWVRDLSSAEDFRCHPNTVVVAIGGPNTPAYEFAKNQSGVEFCLPYEDAESRLRDVAKLLAEVALQRSALALAEHRNGRDRFAGHLAAEPVVRTDDFEFLEAAVAHLGDSRRVVEEFRRAIRAKLQSQRILIFVLREDGVFEAAAERQEYGRDHPFPGWLEQHGAVVDAGFLPDSLTFSAEGFVRAEIDRWNARLVIPFESRKGLGGWIVCGPKGDGRPYSPRDIEETLRYARLLSTVMAQSQERERTNRIDRELASIARYGPNFAIVDDSGAVRGALPVEAREIANIARRKGRMAERDFGKIFVAAGPIPDTGEYWVSWFERDVRSDLGAAQRERERHAILHDLGIILSHELGNALFSVHSYFQAALKNPPVNDPMAPLRDQVANDLKRLKGMPHILSGLFEMTGEPTSEFDLSALVAEVVNDVHGTPELPAEAQPMRGYEKYLGDALRWLVDEARERRDPNAVAAGKLKISLRKREGTADAMYLITISCPGTHLEQLRVGEAKSVAEYPTVPVFLAREIIRWHFGSIHVGQGADGPEIRIVVRSRSEGRLPAEGFEPDATRSELPGGENSTERTGSL